MHVERGVQSVARHVADVAEHVESALAQLLADVAGKRESLEVAFDLGGLDGVEPRVADERVVGHAVR